MSGDLLEAAFVVASASRPRQVARALFFIGAGLALAGLVLALLLPMFLWLTAIGFMIWILAGIARVIGWVAGLGLETAQEVIHDRYDRHHENPEDYKFDPHTGEPIRRKPRFDPYTGEPL